MDDGPWAWWWLCERGHRCAVSVLEMRMAYVRPTCTVMIDEEGHRCWGRLVLSLDPVLPIRRPAAPS